VCVCVCAAHEPLIAFAWSWPCRLAQPVLLDKDGACASDHVQAFGASSKASFKHRW